MTNKPRNRIVVFRLSQDEYHALQEACAREGARNLSEFARAGILEHLQPDAQDGEVNRRFALLEQQIAVLRYRVDHFLQGASHAESRPSA